MYLHVTAFPTLRLIDKPTRTGSSLPRSLHTGQTAGWLPIFPRETRAGNHLAVSSGIVSAT